MANRYPPPYRDPYRPQAPPPAPEPFGGDRKDFLAGMMMPKTVVQLSIWVLMFGLGAGLAGLLLFIVYQSQVNAMEGRLIESQTEVENKLDERLDELEKGGSQPQASATLNVSAAADASEKTRSELIRNVAPGIVGIQGTDSAGKATNGTGFIVNTTAEGSWVLTNYQLVAGSREDSNAVIVKLGPSEIAAEVFEVDPGADLALVVLNVSGKKSLRFTRGELKEGDPVWLFRTAGGNPYATAVEAHLVDYGASRVVVDVDPAAQFNGGPVIDAQGRVVGVLSSKAPKTAEKNSGTTIPAAPATATRGATPIKYACNLVLQCPGTRPKAEPSASPSSTPAAKSSPQPPTQPATQPTDPAQEPPVN